MRQWLIIMLLILAPLSLCVAAEDFYHFSVPEQQERFKSLTTELRCLVCQNQNLAESNAPLASDLREQIYQQILQGKSKQEIVDYLVARYGDFILYRPPLNALTLGLWFGPIALLLTGISYLLYYILKKRRDETPC